MTQAKHKARVRLDVALVDQGLAPSRARAQALVLAGRVEVEGVRAEKPGAPVAADACLHVLNTGTTYVSRGGDKLAGALKSFEGAGLTWKDKRVADIGSSTGGFTDCVLQQGAAQVYAIDVGYGLLHEKLRADSRVTVLERTNGRTLQAAMVGGPVDSVVVDASFIGLGKLVEAITRVLKPGGEVVALVKPQFEAGRAEASRGRGVIRDEAVRGRVIEEVKQQLVAAGFAIVAEAPCAVPGPKGNVEHFLYARLAAGIEAVASQP